MWRLVQFEVNGRAEEVDVEPRETLLDVVRERLGLTGAHAGCEHGACGTCTLLVDGATARSCLVLGVQCEGSSVTTIEAFADLGPSSSSNPAIGPSPPSGTTIGASESSRSGEGATVEQASGFRALAQALMEAFHRHHALQCGFCTPAMVLSAIELLAENREPDEMTVRQGLAGNLCRCTGYAGIVAAVLDVAQARSGASEP